MTGERFVTSCPIFVASILVLFISNLLYGPGMEGMPICSFLTISLAPSMLGIWPVRQRPNSLVPLYNGEKKRFTWETYVRIHTEQHSVLNRLKDYGYAGIDDSSKVRQLLKGIKMT
jgi:hypothetical protein